MEQRTITTLINVIQITELEPEIQVLVNKAREQVDNAYAPYSGFYVGAAVLLANGALFVGNNQENSAYPSGLCAERVALFYANAQYPDVAVRAIAVAAYTNGAYTRLPIAPCGSCRQVMLESEIRFESDIDIYLYGSENIYHLHNVKSLLPIQFDKSCL